MKNVDFLYFRRILFIYTIYLVLGRKMKSQQGFPLHATSKNLQKKALSNKFKS